MIAEMCRSSDGSSRHRNKVDAVSISFRVWKIAP